MRPMQKKKVVAIDVTRTPQERDYDWLSYSDHDCHAMDYASGMVWRMRG